MLQINEILGNKAPLQILHYLAAHTTEDISFTQLERKTELSPATIAKWLKELENGHLISHRSLGNMKLYSIEKEHPLVKQLNILYTLNELLPLRDIGRQFGCTIYLYGSCARGENTEHSDIDLLIIADISKEDKDKWMKIQNSIETFRAKKKLPISMFSLQLRNSLDWAQIARKDPAFYERVEKDKIQIV